MTNALFICLIVTAVGVPAYFLYWHLFRPVLLTRLKYRLYECRDNARILFLSDGFKEHPKAYPLLELFCNKSIAMVDEVDLADLICLKVDRTTVLKVERDFNIVANSSIPIRKIFIQWGITITGAVLANSPGFLIVLVPVFALSVTALWFTRVKRIVLEVIKRAAGAFYLKPC